MKCSKVTVLTIWGLIIAFGLVGFILYPKEISFEKKEYKFGNNIYYYTGKSEFCCIPCEYGCCRECDEEDYSTDWSFFLVLSYENKIKIGEDCPKEMITCAKINNFTFCQEPNKECPFIHKAIETSYQIRPPGYEDCKFHHFYTLTEGYYHFFKNCNQSEILFSPTSYICPYPHFEFTFETCPELFMAVNLPEYKNEGIEDLRKKIKSISTFHNGSIFMLIMLYLLTLFSFLIAFGCIWSKYESDNNNNSDENPNCNSTFFILFETFGCLFIVYSILYLRKLIIYSNDISSDCYQKEIILKDEFGTQKTTLEEYMKRIKLAFIFFTLCSFGIIISIPIFYFEKICKCLSSLCRKLKELCCPKMIREELSKQKIMEELKNNPELSKETPWK